MAAAEALKELQRHTAEREWQHVLPQASDTEALRRAKREQLATLLRVRGGGASAPGRPAGGGLDGARHSRPPAAASPAGDDEARGADP